VISELCTESNGASSYHGTAVGIRGAKLICNVRYLKEHLEKNEVCLSECSLN
jgi:hypothetical protein